MDATTLPELMERRAALSPHEPAFVLPSSTLTYAQLQDAAQDIASSIAALGLGGGDRIGYFLGDGPDCLPILFGILCSGATAVPINNRFKAYELSSVIAQSGISLLFTSPPVGTSGSDYAGLLREAFPALTVAEDNKIECADLPELQYVVSWHEASAGFMARDPFLAASATVHTQPRAEDVAIIKYTSGTTGTPKGAMLRHSAILGAAKGSVEGRFNLTQDDVLWSALPLFHIGGVAFAVACIWAGCPYIHTGFFDPDVAVDQLIEHKVTVSLSAFETIWLPVVNHPRWAEVDQSRLRMVVMVGTENMLRDIQSRHPDAPIMSCFGQTEACGYLSLVMPDDPLDVRINTGGFPLPGMQAKVVNPDTREELPRNTLGEIAYRGPNTFSGYFREPELTASVFDEEGYFYTGDLGLMDAAGRVTFRNRLKDMLKVGGENVAAAEVEDYLLRHPAVNIVQVVAAPDARYVEVPAAFIELKPQANVSEREIIDFCLGNMATFRVPRYVRFVDDWPMSGTKIKKFELRAMIADELAQAGIAEAPKLSSS